MGNTQSYPHKALLTVKSEETHRPPILDMDNMPFLGPPINKGNSTVQDASKLTKAKRVSTVPTKLQLHHDDVRIESINNSMETSPVIPAPARSPASTHTQWNPGHAKWPSYHVVTDSTATNLCGEIAATSPEIGTRTPNRSPSSSHSGSSITSQLSLLSQTCSASPQSRRSVISSHKSAASLDLAADPVDANVPPPVPRHQRLPSSLQRKRQSQEIESASAAIDSLEFEVENDEGYVRSRPRSRSVYGSRSRTPSGSFSRPRSISRSLSGDFKKSNATEGAQGPLKTDVYTRKCQYSAEFSPPGSVTSDGQSDSEDEIDESNSPARSFALDGYNEGSTKLRVVNLEPPSTQSAAYPRIDANLSSPSQICQYRVKSKATIAEETEMRQRKRYARYGHSFRGENRGV